MDKEKFNLACEKIINIERERNGIGTLGEKTLHAVLKNYFEPSLDRHEVKIKSFVADIVAEDEIIEIQTRNFALLRKKLETFLEMGKVTVVYPIPHTKWLIWVDEKTGEETKRRKSPRHGSVYDAFFELYRIKYLLSHPNLKFCFVLIDVHEYRYLNGYSQNRKKGSTRMDRVPIDIVEEVYVNSINNYKYLIPDGLSEEFTAKDFASASKLRLPRAQTALNVLNYINVVERVSKIGNAYVYKKNKTVVD